MEQWVPLLEIFLKSPCPVGEASHWVQTQQHRRGGAAGGSDLWRFVPHLLANDVVYYQGEMEEEEKEQDKHPQQDQRTAPPSRIDVCGFRLCQVPCNLVF